MPNSIHIYETDNFTVETYDHPHNDRGDGGHLIIRPKVRVADRTFLSPALAKELMKLSMVVGEAMTTVLTRHGVDVGRLNYQDNGNWGVFKPEGPALHLHLYGRAKSAKIQKYGEALNFPQPSTGFYDNNQPLTAEDIEAIRGEIERIMDAEKYRNF